MGARECAPTPEFLDRSPPRACTPPLLIQSSFHDCMGRCALMQRSSSRVGPETGWWGVNAPPGPPPAPGRGHPSPHWGVWAKDYSEAPTAPGLPGPWAGRGTRVAHRSIFRRCGRCGGVRGPRPRPRPALPGAAGTFTAPPKAISPPSGGLVWGLEGRDFLRLSRGLAR